MITYKTDEEISHMEEGGKKLKEVVQIILSLIRPGVQTAYIDTVAEREIRKRGAKPSFHEVPGYKWTICSPINDQVVHTPPSKRVLKNGDILTIDIGVYFKGLHTDYATTVVVGDKSSDDIFRFLKTGKDALQLAIQEAVLGKRIGNISQTIQEVIQKGGYCIMHQLTGHGVGKELHEDPFIPGYVDGDIQKTPLIKPGMTLALEVIYAMGTTEIIHENNNNWSIITKDGSLSACFEHTVAINAKNTVVLT